MPVCQRARSEGPCAVSFASSVACLGSAAAISPCYFWLFCLSSFNIQQYRKLSLNFQKQKLMRAYCPGISDLTAQARQQGVLFFQIGGGMVPCAARFRSDLQHSIASISLLLPDVFVFSTGSRVHRRAAPDPGIVHI